MTGVVQAVQEILEAYNKIIYHPNVDPMAVGDLTSAMSLLQISDYYEVNRDITLFTNDLKKEWSQNCKKLSDVRVQVDARLPSNPCFLYMTNSETGYLLQKHEAATTNSSIEELQKYPSVTVVRMDKKHKPILCGGYIISDKEQNNSLFTAHPNAEADAGLENFLANAIMSISLILSLINQPRFVVRGSTGTRQLKKQMHRGHGISMNAWHKIEWNINEPVKAKDDSDRGGWRMPLHYTRGHWRKGQDHWDDVVIRNDGQPYKWIEGFWSGHPAYGVKKSYHAPKLGKSYENV